MQLEDSLKRQPLAFFDELGWPVEKTLQYYVEVFVAQDFDTIAKRFVNYKKYRAKLRRTQGQEAVGQLHGEIDRFYYSIQTGRLVSSHEIRVEEHFDSDNSLHRRLRIGRGEEGRQTTAVWIWLATIYVDGLTKRKLVGKKRMRSPTPPPEWMKIVESRERKDFDLISRKQIQEKDPNASDYEVETRFRAQATERNFHRFVFDLKLNWGTVVREFEAPKTQHGVRVEDGHGDVARRRDIERGWTPARKAHKKVKIGNYVLDLPAQEERRIITAPLPLADYLELSSPEKFYEAVLAERDVYVQPSSHRSYCATVDKLPYIYLKVGVNPIQSWAELDFAEWLLGARCRRSAPDGLRIPR